MTRKGSQRSSGVTRVDHSPRDRISNLIRVRSDVDDRVSKLGGRRRISRVVYVGALRDRRIAWVQKFVPAGIISRKPLRIVFGSHPPRITIMTPLAQPIDLLGHVAIRSILCPE